MAEPLIDQLREMAVRGLRRMYRRQERLFVFRLRRGREGVVSEGLSRRYTAIALIGLAEHLEVAPSVLERDDPRDVCARLVGDASLMDNLGDAALTAWASTAVGYPDRDRAWSRLVELRPAGASHATVDLAWTLSALCHEPEAALGDLRDQVARRLIQACDARSGLFPHRIGGGSGGLHAHVASFADQVYPIQALSWYGRASGHQEAVEVAVRCARVLCDLQGCDGQWWWHYDPRSGRVLERYPVYAIHQDSMGPMALSAVGESSGIDFSPSVDQGLAWLERAPELAGASLIDVDADLIWRKVARREPRKLSRYLQAAASRVHPRLRAPGLDLVFPPVAVDYEDRPYHLGWLLYAWPASKRVPSRSGVSLT
jgi:hypothetical protein